MSHVNVIYDSESSEQDVVLEIFEGDSEQTKRNMLNWFFSKVSSGNYELPSDLDEYDEYDKYKDNEASDSDLDALIDLLFTENKLSLEVWELVPETR